MKLQLFMPEQEYKEIKSEGWTRPHGIGIIGTYVKEKGFDVELLSGVSGTSNQEMIERVSADIVGISTTIGNYKGALKIAMRAKEKNPSCLTILGGSEATQLYKEILTNRGKTSTNYCVDIVACGDGVKSFYEIVSGKDLSSINNIAFLQNGKIVATQRIREDKSYWPIVNSSLFDMEKIVTTYGNKFSGVTPFKRATSIMSQYGCNVYHCKFCGRTDRLWYGRDTKEMWKEIRELVEVNKAELLFDFSDSFIQKPDYAKRFLKDKPSDLTPAFRFFARADHINNETVQLFRDLGTYEVYVGFESGDQQMLDNMAKQTAVEQNLYAAKLLGECGMRILGSFVLGAPGETSQSLENTVNHVRQIQEVSGHRLEQCLCSVWMPLPGSWGFREIQEEVEGKDDLDLIEIKQIWAKKMCNVSYAELNKYVDRVLENSQAPVLDVKGVKNAE